MSQTQVVQEHQDSVEKDSHNREGVSNNSAGLEHCPVCQRGYRHKEYLDHLFQNKDCMRSYWQEEERTHAYRVRHRSLSRKKEREALARQQEQFMRTNGTIFA